MTPTLHGMRPTTLPARPLGRRVAAATAALGLAATLTACTIGTGDDGETAGSGTTAATGSADPAAPVESGDREPGTPDTPVGQLILGENEVDGLKLVAIPADQISEGLTAMRGISEGARVDPPECADFNQATLDAQAAPDATAISTGQVGQSPVALAVSTVTDGLEGQRESIERCPSMTVVLPIQGIEATTTTTNELLPDEAPEGVEHFVAISQKTTMNLAGVSQGSTNIVLNGVVRGVAVTVSATGPESGVPDDARDAAMRAFAAQVEKIRGA